MLFTIYLQYGLMVINKAPGICSDPHPEHGHPQSACEFVAARFGSQKYVNVHRIDKDTSGLLLFATSNVGIGGKPANVWIQNNWHAKVHKTYLAIVRTPSWMENECDLPLSDFPGEPSKTCKTAFRVLQSIGGYSLVECRLVQNGRKHQIRKHLKHLGSPIVGDTKYGGGKSQVRSGQLLHAWKVQIDFPSATEVFTCQTPDDFRNFEFDWDLID